MTIMRNCNVYQFVTFYSVTGCLHRSSKRDAWEMRGLDYISASLTMQFFQRIFLNEHVLISMGPPCCSRKQRPGKRGLFDA